MLAGGVDPPRCARLGPPPSAEAANIGTAQSKDLMTIPNSSWVFLHSRRGIAINRAITNSHGALKAEAPIF
jgi:hypothetical protein